MFAFRWSATRQEYVDRWHRFSTAMLHSSTTKTVSMSHQDPPNIQENTLATEMIRRVRQIDRCARAGRRNVNRRRMEGRMLGVVHTHSCRAIALQRRPISRVRSTPRAIVSLPIIEGPVRSGLSDRNSRLILRECPRHRKATSPSARSHGVSGPPQKQLRL